MEVKYYLNNFKKSLPDYAGKIKDFSRAIASPKGLLTTGTILAMTAAPGLFGEADIAQANDFDSLYSEEPEVERFIDQNIPESDEDIYSDVYSFLTMGEINKDRYSEDLYDRALDNLAEMYTSNDVSDENMHDKDFYEKIDQILGNYADFLFGDGDGNVEVKELERLFDNLADNKSFQTLSRELIDNGIEENRMFHAQNILEDEGYEPGPVDGMYGPKTKKSLYAFQKVHGLDVDGDLNSKTIQALSDPIEPEPKYNIDGTHVEVNVDDQLLYVVDDKNVEYVLHVSTGEEGATPLGYFEIHKMEESGWRNAINSDGEVIGKMYNPIHFHGNFYIHGSKFVPLWNDSKGCVRTEEHHMYPLHDELELYDPVITYSPETRNEVIEEENGTIELTRETKYAVIEDNEVVDIRRDVGSVKEYDDIIIYCDMF